MNNFECFCESVFYESTGLGSLYELDNALKVYIRAIRLTEVLDVHNQTSKQMLMKFMKKLVQFFI